MADSSEDSVVWVQRLAVGEEQIVQEFWERYGASLQRLAKSRMVPALQQRVGAEDVVQSVCRTFFRRAGQHEFELRGTDSLWRLLCAITLTKVRQHARFHYRECRTPDRETPLAGEDSSREAGAGDRPARPADPTPDEIAAFADQMQRLFAVLSEEEQALVRGKLEGLTQIEIAELVGCSERTVRRLLDSVRKRWEKELEHSLSDASQS
jgi:RNA polymerase sigma-70 factor (ECF subfamily)